MAMKVREAGRVAARVAAAVRNQITSGQVAVGQYLPRVLDLSRTHNVSPETARRAMKLLEAERWVRGFRGHGFRVLTRSEEAERAAVVAFVFHGASADDQLEVRDHLLGALHRAAADRGWSVFGISPQKVATDEAVEELKAARVSGLILDTANKRIISQMDRLGLPVVMIEEWSSDRRIDSVRQDDFEGGFRAAKYLAERGHRRICWFGPLVDSSQSIERWAGAVAALRDRIGPLPPELTVNFAAAGADERLQSLLAAPERPTAILALWNVLTIRVARMLADQGLVLGRDVDLVGWSAAESYAAYAAAFPHGLVPPTITWSSRSLVETALTRLADRRANPDLPIVRIGIEATLVLPETRTPEQ